MKIVVVRSVIATFLLAAVTTQGQLKEAGEVVSKYRNVFTMPPSRTPSTVAVDAPLLGNGFTAAAIAGAPEQQHYYLARNDFWRLRSGYNESYPAVLGSLSINMDALQDASYRIEQDLYTATTYSTFRKGDTVVRMQSMMAATKDLLWITINNQGKVTIKGKAHLELPGPNQFHIDPPLENKFPDSTGKGIDGDGVQWIQRAFVKEVDIVTTAVAACKIVGSNRDSFLLAPGQSTTIVCAFSSRFKQTAPLQWVKQQVKNATNASLIATKKEHEAWWRAYWNESFVSLGDSAIEHQYYRSQYNMAACSRDPKFPPGIFGSWVTKEIPAWNGDYHLNYNYTAPFYALYSSNHLKQALPYEAPLLDFIPRGKYYAAKITSVPEGILYPVGIGPLGIETTRKNELMIKHRSGYISSGEAEDEGLFFGQKSNAAYCAVNFCMQFYRTYDPVFTRRVYPYMRSVAMFWQLYLKKENGRYVIENDAIHEGTIGTQNPILSLGLVPLILKTTIDMSQLLGEDKQLRGNWQGKIDSLSRYTTQERHGKTVFRYSEKGTDWWNDNTLGIQHIYPGGAIGLNSDPALLETARNTIAEMQRWKDFNGTNSYYPAAVRVGYNADTILHHLRAYSMHTYPNGFQKGNPHGIENCSTVPNTINEMLCMGHQNLLRVFAVWPADKDAAFSHIRSEGAFLVSAALQKRQVQYVRIISEQGRTLVLQNPWPGKTVLVKSNKRSAIQQSGERITLATGKGEVLMITAF